MERAAEKPSISACVALPLAGNPHGPGLGKFKRGEGMARSMKSSDRSRATKSKFMGNRSADFRISKRDFGEPMCVARGWGEHHALQLEDDLACMKQWRCEKNEFNPEPDQRSRTGIFSAIAAEDGACARVAIGIPDRASEDAREKDSRLDWKSRPVARPAESASVQRGDESKSFGGGA